MNNSTKRKKKDWRKKKRGFFKFLNFAKMINFFFLISFELFLLFDDLILVLLPFSVDYHSTSSFFFLQCKLNDQFNQVNRKIQWTMRIWKLKSFTNLHFMKVQQSIDHMQMSIPWSRSQCSIIPLHFVLPSTKFSLKETHPKKNREKNLEMEI